MGLYGSRVTLAGGESVVADEAYLTESMMDPLAKIVAGFQPVMPTYQGRLTPGDTAAVLELIKSVRGGVATTSAGDSPAPVVGRAPTRERP